MCDIVQPPTISMAPIADMDKDVAIVTAALATKTIAETPRKKRREAMAVQRTSYRSWCFHHTPFSLRPFGARSSHWYIPQRLSTPRE